MRDDRKIKADIEAELSWDARIDARDVAVTVKDGVVALSGLVAALNDRGMAEEDAKRVEGVIGLANDICVRVLNADGRSDIDILREAVGLIRVQFPESGRNVQVIVKDRWLILDGHTDWQFESEAIEKAMRQLKGVVGFTNTIRVDPKILPSNVKESIEAALRRNAQLDPSHISVDVAGTHVVLRGEVHTWAERTEAQRIAWSAAGVTLVDNSLTITLQKSSPAK